MFCYAENNSADRVNVMDIEIDDVLFSSSIAGKGYNAGDLVWFYFQDGAVDNGTVVPVGATKLFAIPMIGSATLLPLLPDVAPGVPGGSTQFTAIGRNVKYQNPPLVMATGLTVVVPLKNYHSTLDLKPWVPAGAVEAFFNDNVEIHSSASAGVIGGSVLSTPLGNIKNISLYPPIPSSWAPADVTTVARLRRFNQVMTANFEASSGQLDNISQIALIEGYTI